MHYYEGKTAVITGAASGLGRALAIELHRQGCHLALIDKDEEGLLQLQQLLPPGQQRTTLHRADIANEEAVIAAREEIKRHHAWINILVNNAAISASQPFAEMNVLLFQQVLNVNFWGTVFCTRHFLHDLKQGKTSVIVNIISSFALTGLPGKTAYGASKSAVTGFTHSLQTELAGTGVRACLVIPPALNTNLVRKGLHVSEAKKAAELQFMEKYSWQPDRAARNIVRQVAQKKYRIRVGRNVFFTDLLCRWWPSGVLSFISRNKKKFDFS